MKKIILLLFCFFALAALKAGASDNWRITFNNKVIFKGSDNQMNPLAILKRTKVRKSDCLLIQYNTQDADKRWKRIFYINDSSEQSIKTIDLDEQNGSVSVDASVLQEMTKKSPVFIYTVSLPKDPALAAAIRVRRILLCKIEWN